MPVFSEFLSWIAIPVIFIIGVISKKRKSEQKSSHWNKRALVVIFLITTVGAITSGLELNEKYHWYYMVNQNEIRLYDLSKDDEFNDSNLIERYAFSELTPYFKYRRISTGKRTSSAIQILLKTDDGKVVFEFRDDDLESVVDKYKPLHQQNPNLLNQMEIVQGTQQFKEFVSRLIKE